MTAPIYLSPLTQSPESDVATLSSDSDYDSDGSASTLDYHHSSSGSELGLQFGEPLRRMVQLESVEEDDEVTLNDICGFSGSSSSEYSSNSSVNNDIDYEAIVDTFISNSSSDLLNTINVLPLPRTSIHLLILLQLNLPHIRSNPWNPAPHIIQAVERGETVYLCLEKLNDWNVPPLKRIGDYIDFFRQVLEGLTFLHEHHVTGIPFSLSTPSSISVNPDPPSLPHVTRPVPTKFPVRFHFTDFSSAVHSEPRFSGKADVKCCGAMLRTILEEKLPPPIQSKFKSLVNAMMGGEFGADDARRLFEALCRSLEARLFDEEVA